MLSPAVANARPMHRTMPPIYAVAGSRFAMGLGEGMPATMADVRPFDVAATRRCGVLIAERYSGRVRRIGANGMITTVAGNGRPGFAGDGGPGAAAEFLYPRGVSALPDGSVLVADEYNRRVRRVSTTGTVTTVAGSGTPGFSGDGGPGSAATLGLPVAVAGLPDGSFLIADALNARVRRVAADGTIETVAGNGGSGFSGDGGPATKAQIGFPVGVSPTPDGGFLIADQYGARVRRVSAGGTITSVAGIGIPGFSGDGGPAIRAKLDYPRGVAGLADGGALIADQGNARVRRVWPNGRITTLADTRMFGGPRGVALTPDGGALIATPRGVEFIDAHLPSGQRGPACRRLLLRITSMPRRAGAGQLVSIRLIASMRGRLRLMLRRHHMRRTPAYSASMPRAMMIRGGHNRIAFRAPMRGGRYRIQLVARSRDGKRAVAISEIHVHGRG